jgi:hypothetical protein
VTNARTRPKGKRLTKCREFQDTSLEMLVKKINTNRLIKIVYQQEPVRTVQPNKALLEQKKKLIIFLSTVATARASTSTLMSEIVKFPSEINNEILVILKRYRRYSFFKCLLFALVKITNGEKYQFL